MATLGFNEKAALEAAFGMSSGYVLDFSDRTFREFILDHVGRDIHDGAYSKYGTSKAKHLRALWEVEPDSVVAVLTDALLEHGRERELIDDKKLNAAKAVVARLHGSGEVADIDALKPNAREPTFDRLARAVRESIDAGRPEEGLDRLHTFMVKYVRVLAQKHGIDTPRDKPLHSLIGEYIKRLQAEGILQSAMTVRIMKSAIASLEAFNNVRNEQSLAHDNEILRTHEALYIFNHIASLVRFLQVVEGAIPDIPLDDLSAPANTR
jgi:hypothetical protein